ncbi:MAG: hypothetical protein ABL921_17240, partial [Pirellula sp.]
DLLAKRRERANPGGGGGGGGGDFAAIMAEMAKLNAELDSQFIAKLDDTQKARLNGLIAQVNGAVSLLDPAISAALQLKEDQVAKLKSVNDANRTARRDALQGKSPEEMRELVPKLTEKDNAALLASLSDDQKKKFEELKGAALTIDTTPLRGNRGGNRN